MEENNGSEPNNTINITYETIFELLRREKNRDELQKLNESFYKDIQNYILEKNNLIMHHGSSTSSEAEREKTAKQISNTKKMITELFERREKKIIIHALNKVRTASAITDSSAMLNDEKDFFNKLTDTFSEYRRYILNKMIIDKNLPYSPSYPTNSSNEENEINPNKDEARIEKKEKKQTKTLKILSQIPKFMGKELEVYGPFNPDDMASLPTEIADILIKKGRAEEITSE